MQVMPAAPSKEDAVQALVMKGHLWHLGRQPSERGVVLNLPRPVSAQPSSPMNERALD